LGGSSVNGGLWAAMGGLFKRMNLPFLGTWMPKPSVSSTNCWKKSTKHEQKSDFSDKFNEKVTKSDSSQKN